MPTFSILFVLLSFLLGVKAKAVVYALLIIHFQTSYS